MTKPRVGILTNFTGCDQAFSLVVVVKTQLKTLIDAGYRPVLFVASQFVEGEGVFSSKQIEIRKVAPYDTDADGILKALKPIIQDIDILLCHDLVFLSHYREWGEAIRKLADETEVKFIHWQHSRGDEVRKGCANSWYSYPNQGDLEHVAYTNNSPIDRVRYIPHPLDFDYLGWSELAVRIAEETKLPFVDVACVLPSRLDRMKQIEKAVRVMAGIKRAGRSICFICADAFATGSQFMDYKKDVMQIAKQEGISDDVHFLGDEYDECKYATPRQVVKSLYEMSNLFILPSNAETSSLVAMEAALAGSLLVLNADFTPIHHLYKGTIALPFGSVTQAEQTKYFRHIKTTDGEIKVEDPQAYFDDQARQLVLPVLEAQVIQKVKRQQLRERWPSVVFKEYLEPLIMEACPEPKVVEMKGDPEITAIITTLDNLPLLKEQVEILRYEVGHIIVVNNGSEDGTREWLIDNPMEGVSYINRENKGAGPGRNAGLALWDKIPTPYTLMVDGGILPIRGAVEAHKDYLLRHPEAHVISPEVASNFTVNKDDASLHFNCKIETTFDQSYLSSTAYCLCRADTWKIRFKEDGPFGEPGWGVDDNEISYRWKEAGIVHHEYTYQSIPVLFYRRQGGSHARLQRETGIGPNQYGSVYEKRNVYCYQEYPFYHRGIGGHEGKIEKSYIIKNVEYPELAKLVKQLHDGANGTGYEIIVNSEGLSENTLQWIEQARLRFQWGDTQIDSKGDIIKRVPENEALWTGNFRVDAEPYGLEVDIVIPT